MSIAVSIFYPALQRLLGEPGELVVEGATVGECLEDLVRRYPESAALLFDAQGALLKTVYVFVNAESMFKAESSKPVTGRDRLIIAALAVGG